MPDAKERQEKVRKDLETIRKHADFLQNHAGAAGTGLRGVFTFDATHPTDEIKNTITSLSAGIPAHQGPGGVVIPLTPGKLSLNELKSLVDYENGGAGKLSNTLNVALPAAVDPAGRRYAEHANRFRTQVDDLIIKTNATLTEIENNATENVNNLLSAQQNVPPVTEEQWAGGFQGPLKRLEIAIQTKIDDIKAEKAAGPTSPDYPAHEFNVNTQAQIESLEKMKVECRAQVEKLQDGALLKTIQEAKFGDGLGAGLAAGPNQVQLNNSRVETLAKHAQLAHQAQLQGAYTHVEKKGLLRDTRVERDPSRGFESGQTYEAKFSKWWIFNLKSKPFSISTSEDGKDVYRFKIGGNKEELGRILDAFFAGQEEGTLKFRGQGKINIKHLQELATIAHTPPRDYKINLGSGIIENLRKKHKMDDAEILRLGKQLGGPDWEMPSTAPKQRA